MTEVVDLTLSDNEEGNVLVKRPRRGEAGECGSHASKLWSDSDLEDGAVVVLSPSAVIRRRKASVRPRRTPAEEDEELEVLGEEGEVSTQAQL
jgi:hypothetical protein